MAKTKKNITQSEVIKMDVPIQNNSDSIIVPSVDEATPTIPLPSKKRGRPKTKKESPQLFEEKISVITTDQLTKTEITDTTNDIEEQPLDLTDIKPISTIEDHFDFHKHEFEQFAKKEERRLKKLAETNERKQFNPENPVGNSKFKSGSQKEHKDSNKSKSENHHANSKKPRKLELKLRDKIDDPKDVQKDDKTKPSKVILKPKKIKLLVKKKKWGK